MVIDSSVFQWVILPLLIFLARACDVSIGTVRIILLSKNKRFLAPLLGFFEILIWLLAIRQLFINLTNPLCYVAYAGGFATGTYLGIIIEEKLAIGFEVIRIITKKDGRELIEHLQNNGYGVTSAEATGSTGPVHIIFTIIKRSDVQQVLTVIKRFNPKAFYTVENISSVKEGIFPKTRMLKH